MLIQLGNLIQSCRKKREKKEKLVAGKKRN
jgi:hypothetical protein